MLRKKVINTTKNKKEHSGIVVVSNDALWRMRDKRIPNLSHLVAFFASDGIYFCNCLTNGLIFHDYKSILGDRKTNKKIYHSFLTELKQKRKYLQPMHLASLHCRMVQPSKIKTSISG